MHLGVPLLGLAGPRACASVLFFACLSLTAAGCGEGVLAGRDRDALAPSSDRGAGDAGPADDASTADLHGASDGQAPTQDGQATDGRPPTPDGQQGADLPLAADQGAPSDAPPMAKAVTLSKVAFEGRGGPLSDAVALARIRSAAEIRSENATANATFPTDAQLQTFYAQDSWGGVAAQANAYRQMITGRPGKVLSTDEIIQWAAHKWGIDEDVMRAVAVTESWWRQSATGDFTADFSLCPSGAATRDNGGTTECAQSYGLMQMKWIYHGKNVWPLSRDSTPFNVEYLACRYRAVMDGHFTYLGDDTAQAGYPSYPTGSLDELLWGSVGAWYSGSWYDAGALGYIVNVKNHLAQETWAQPGF